MAKLRAVLMTTAFAAFAASFASAQQPAPMQGMPGHQGMPGMSMPGMSMPSADASPSTKAYQAANDKMMKDMGANMTGDADRDFVGGMIPHHSGAIDMAKIELEYGKDPMLRELAKGIITAQEKEIAEMTAWQKAHPAKP
jgi:uncharacterized protein (DUF305 family)